MLILLLAGAKIQIDVQQRIDKKTRATNFSFKSNRIEGVNIEKKEIQKNEEAASQARCFICMTRWRNDLK